LDEHARSGAPDLTGLMVLGDEDARRSSARHLTLTQLLVEPPETTSGSLEGLSMRGERERREVRDAGPATAVFGVTTELLETEGAVASDEEVNAPCAIIRLDALEDRPAGIDAIRHDPRLKDRALPLTRLDLERMEHR